MKDANGDLAVGCKRKLKSFLDQGGIEPEEDDQSAPPIADLFPDCTVFFADIGTFNPINDLRQLP